MSTIEDLRDAFRAESARVHQLADRAYAATHDQDSTDSDHAAMELVGNRAIDLVIAIGKLR